MLSVTYPSALLRILGYPLFSYKLLSSNKTIQIFHLLNLSIFLLYIIILLYRPVLLEGTITCTSKNDHNHFTLLQVLNVSIHHHYLVVDQETALKLIS